MEEWIGQKLLKNGKYGANKKLTIDQVANQIWAFGDREFEDMKRDGVICGHYRDYYIYGPYTKELDDKVKEIRKKELEESIAIKKLNEAIEKVLNETAERYLSVLQPDNNKFSAEVILYEGDKPIQSFTIDSNILPNPTETEIIEYAKQHFDNITDDIRVQWF